MKNLFRQFVRDHGPFDVIHFQTLEGLPLNVLELKKEFPNMRFVHSIHDYGLFCPNVRLWTDRQTNCYTDSEKRDCSLCMRRNISVPRQMVISLRPSESGVGAAMPSFTYRVARKILTSVRQKCGLPRWGHNYAFEEFRKRNVDMVNQYVDAELCVSERVAEIALHYGIRKDKLRVSYIGTKVAEGALYQPLTHPNTPILTILFMGYAAKEKGFFFFLDALEQLPEAETKTIALKFASKIKRGVILNRVLALRKQYHSVTIYNGYSHADFPKIMGEVNIGIVPPQWEDNLPQVAIEMIANGIPVLASNHGGAHELNSHPAFVFSTKDDLNEKLLQIKANRSLLNEYWHYSRRLTTMDEHMAGLLNIYQSHNESLN